MKKLKPVEYEKIIRALGERVQFAINTLRPPAGGGTMMDMRTGKQQGWKDYCADALEMVPGWKVNRELMNMTPAQRRKARRIEPQSNRKGKSE